MLNALIDWLKQRFLGSPRAPAASPFPLRSGPARLLILRHAEKTGEKSDPHLSAKGAERAERLARYIPQTFGKPDFLMAAKSSKRSRRPVETLEPLAAATGLTINGEFDDKDVRELVEELGHNPSVAGKFGVVSWRHSDIPRLLAELGSPAGSYPDPWGEGVYDLMFELEFLGSAPPRVHQVRMP